MPQAAPSAPQQPSPAPQNAESGPWEDFAPKAAPAAPQSGITDQGTVSALPDQKVWTADDIDAHLGEMLHDQKVSGNDIRKWLTSIGSQLTEDDQATLDRRDAWIKEHPGEGGGNVESHAIPFTPDRGGIVDNRPVSFWTGTVDGAEHIGENVVGGAGWAANKLGVENDWRKHLHDRYQAYSDGRDDRGSQYGKLVGEVVTTLPTALVAAPVEGGAVAIGVPVGIARTLGFAADGALGGALTTDADTPGGVARDAATGAVLGSVLGRASDAVGARIRGGSSVTREGREVLDAADQLSRDGLNVRPLPADVGGAASRNLTAGVSQGFVGRGIVDSRATNYRDAVAAARDRAANELAPAGETAQPLHEVADEIASDAGLGGYRARSKAESNRLYDQAENLANNAAIQTPRTVRVLNQKISELSAIPGGHPAVRTLEAVRDDLLTNQNSVAALRRLRTNFGRQLEAVSPDAREIAGSIYRPLSDDIDAGLRAQNLTDAADAYRAADAHYAARASTLRDVEAIIGRRGMERSPEQVAGRLTALVKGQGGDAGLVGRVLDTLNPDQAARVRSSMISNLGRSKPSAQTHTGDAFSFQTFLTQWQRENLSDAAKAVLIPDARVRADLDAIARLSSAARRADAVRNFSNTAGASYILGLIGKVSSPAGGLATVGSSLLPEGLTAAAVSSPNVARAIVRGREIAGPVINRTLQAGAITGRRSAPAVSGYLADLSGLNDADPTPQPEPLPASVQAVMDGAPPVRSIASKQRIRSADDR